MLTSISVLQSVAKCGHGGGVRSFIMEDSGLSAFIVTKRLRLLCDEGFLVRVKNRFYLTRRGNNFVLAWEADFEGYEVSVVQKSEWSYPYQKSYLKR